jgi:adenylylsulfate kinase
MSDNNKEIHPVFDKILLKGHKEELLKQHAQVIWMTGLSGAGKSTIASGLEKALYSRGYLTQIIDGDNIRSGLNRNLGFSGEIRTENLRKIVEVTKFILNCGVITINSFITPTTEARKMVKDIVGSESIIAVFINAPIEVCEGRDVKGLYKKARKGLIKDFTGIDATFEAPLAPAIEVNTDKETLEESINKIISGITDKIEIQDA